MRLIDANALLRDMEAYLALKPGMAGTMYEFMQFVALDCVETAPTIEAKPVVHGRWEFSNDDGENFYYRCSHCGRDVKAERYAESNDYCYCPYCNAQMDEKEDL